ncbi:3-hydroxyacyl-CoA dehydrogenase [Paucibacter sp. TC2R-5]|uniref:3-hydroxyacyl-CoA dehydrogenase n=1 Tax=Paucibacter sp. TC2R-5 TaxID=2893555 RepID=UPI0021E36FD5|nr:3-hydroxyacyl-CoA dehydrogenase [Paucibacter sp. TC2R-5]MCV2360107.1 3-hydroxyacyl-CoA dehydrogenase [Paucibacter sp. TC2R-5]
MSETKQWAVAAERPALIGVVGAGVMGAGIAQVAAQAGHAVLLLDLREGAAASAIAQTARALDALVAKGRMEAVECAAVLARIQPAQSMAELKDAALVIEVIVEKLEPKQTLLRELDALLGEGAIIASNTSSISVTALANGMQNPGRLVGMHFFNPVPLMKLVEVVWGAETEASVAEVIEALARRWGKTPVHAKSTPGFIVNRIARPFYAEALALLQEQAATPALIDRALRAAGFRMGPCELMDLIGHDTNFLVTQSVFEANFGDKRYMPSLVQKALVDGGRLGRKVGKGFYIGLPEAAGPVEAPKQALAAIGVVGRGPLVDTLAACLDLKGLTYTRGESADWNGLSVGDVHVHLSSGVTAAQLAAEWRHPQLAVMDWPLAPGRVDALALSVAPQLDDAGLAAIEDVWRALGWQPLRMRDVPGLAVARTVAMLVNEGCDAVWQGVCDERAADLACKLGVNYPAGPFEWLPLIGAPALVATLDGLFAAYRSERYRVSPLLQQRRWSEPGHKPA